MACVDATLCGGRASNPRMRHWTEATMFELFVLVAILGSLWLVGSLLGFVFKLVFGLIGGVFSLVGGLLALFVGGALMLVMLPVFALMLLPLLLPVLLVVGIVWLIVRAARRPAPAVAVATH
jgi:hypothetical protein